MEKTTPEAPLRLLICGAAGQLGRELRRLLTEGASEIGPIPARYAGASVTYADVADLDITDGEATGAFMAQQGPFDVVINCAAFTNVDGCEASEDAAYAVNATGAQNLACACAACGATLVHVSTDYVFSGTEAGERTEADEPAPLSAYGRTKLAGERLALAANPRTHVVRTAWLYGYAGKNFVKTMLRLARANAKISVVADQLGNPTSANDLAHELLRIALTEDFGVWHCTGEGTCSWFDFACAIVDAAGVPCEREPLTSAEYKRRFPKSADRPAFSSLANTRLAATIGNEMRPWQDALASYFAHADQMEG